MAIQRRLRLNCNLARGKAIPCTAAGNQGSLACTYPVSEETVKGA